MADLTPAQLSFVQQFFNYDAKKYFQKKRLKSLVQDFFRRRDKAEAEIRDLPPDHPQLAALKQAIKDATTKAEQGNMKGAYNDLKGAKDTARTAANVAKSGVNIGAINVGLQNLDAGIRRLLTEQARARQMADNLTQALLNRAALLRDPSGGANREEVLETISENFREKQEILAEWDTAADNIKQALDTYQSMLSTPPTVTDDLAALSHNIMLFNRDTADSGKMAHNGQFASLDQRAIQNHLTGQGAELRTEINTMMTTRRTTLLDTLKTKTTAPGLQATQFTDDAGKVLEGKAATDAAAAMAKRFKHLEAREAERMEAVKKAMRNATLTDTVAMSITEDRSAVTDTRIRPFDTADLMDENNIDVTDTRKRPDELADAAGTALADLMDDLMANGDIPDEVFEMCTRSARDWYIEAAKSAGIAFDPDKPDTIDPTVWAKIKAVGDAMRAKAQEKYPEKVNCDAEGKMTEVTIGGVTYSQISYLGGGGGGDVWKAIDPVSGDAIVIKAPKGFSAKDDISEQDHQSLRKEGSNHRAVSGGEDGACPDNILDMKAMVMAPNGAPLIAMDLADAGDAEGYTEAMGACESSGLISETARQAMMAAQMRDIVMGMKAMQDKGMTHHDLKEANVFLSSDGTFKVADFGLGEHVDARDSAVPDLVEYTPGYQPPELLGSGDVTQKSDNFTLGEILEKISDPMRGHGEFSSKFSAQNPGPEQIKDNTGAPVMVSALDRAINRLKDPDPSKRPTLDAVLMSSFFQDVDASYRPEDVTRLKKASAEYAKTVGRETADLNKALTWTQGDIAQLEMSKSDALTQAKIDHTNKFIAARQAEINELQRKMGISWDDEEKADLQEKIDAVTNYMNSAQQKVVGFTNELGAAKSSTDIEAIEKKIAAKRQEVIDLNKRIAAIHEKPEYKTVIDELNAANKAFS